MVEENAVDDGEGTEKVPREEPGAGEGHLIVFGGKQIRRAWLDNQWYFSVIDIIGALTDSASPPKYWDAMKRREKESSGVDLSTFCRKVRLTGADGKSYASDAVVTVAGFFQTLDGLGAGDGGKIVEEFAEGVSAFEVVDEILERNARAGEDDGPGENFGIAMEDGALCMG
jgi:hypothetical protein